MKSLDQNLSTAVRASIPRPSWFWLGYLLVAIALVGAPGCLLVAPLILLGRFFRPLELWSGRCTAVLIKWMLHLNFWIRKDIRLNLPYGVGRENHPTLIIANHRSILDVFFLISYVPNVRIIAKRNLFLVPFLGPMMWVMRQIPVARGNLSSYLKAVEVARTGLRKGDPVVFFPEGRRCDRGYKGTLRFYPTPFQLAKEEGVPVYPIVFAGTDKIWPRGSVGLAPGLTACMLSLDPLYPEDFLTPHAMMRECQKRINQSLAGL